MTAVARRAGAALAVAVVVWAGAAPAADAHGLGANPTPAVPAWLFAWAAGIALVVSFALLGTFWTTPRLQARSTRVGVRVPPLLEPVCGAIGVAGFVGLVLAGLTGAQDALDNVVPTWVYVAFWVVVPVLSALVGDLFRPLNPWRALARATSAVVRHAGLGRHVPEPVAYPARLGRWPAVGTVLAFGWLELVFANRDDPRLLATCMLVYAVLQLVAMGIYGIDAWERRGDGFAVYFGMFASLSPLRWSDGRVSLRPPLAGAASDWAASPGMTALVCVALGVTTFDGLSAGPAWLSAVPWLQRRFAAAGIGLETALELASTLGLLACVLLVSALYRLGIHGIRACFPGATGAGLGRRFAHSLIPIALAYLVAHYASLVIFQGQALIAFASDPTGGGSDWFGTASVPVDSTLVGADVIWALQVVALLCGHIAGLALAHDRALADAGSPRAAARSQQWMLAVMVTFTSLALWLISSANA